MWTPKTPSSHPETTSAGVAAHAAGIGEKAPMDTDTDKLVHIYIKMRDARKGLLSDYERKDKEIEEQMDLISSELLAICKTTNADSIKTKHGTVIRSIKERFWTSDFGALYETILKYKAPELLEKRVAQANMKQFLEEHPEGHPPGLNVDRQFTVVVRRSK